MLNNFKIKVLDSGNVYNVEKADKGYTMSWLENDVLTKGNIVYSEVDIQRYLDDGSWLILDETKIKTIHKDMNFNDLTGRYFQITFRCMVDYINNFTLKDSTLEYIEGYIENFVPMEAVVFNDVKYGFNIIPYQLIVKMTEVKEIN